MDITVGIGEYAISNNAAATLKTFALGSCVAVVFYSPRRMAAGLAHIALPSSGLDPARSKRQPAHFVDTAIPFLLEEFRKRYGCAYSELQVSVFGGAETMQQSDSFKIGPKNIEAVRKLLQEYNIMCYKEDTGGGFSRNLEVAVASGDVKVGLYPLLRCGNTKSGNSI